MCPFIFSSISTTLEFTQEERIKSVMLHLLRISLSHWNNFVLNSCFMLSNVVVKYLALLNRQENGVKTKEFSSVFKEDITVKA